MIATSLKYTLLLTTFLLLLVGCDSREKFSGQESPGIEGGKFIAPTHRDKMPEFELVSAHDGVEVSSEGWRRFRGINGPSKSVRHEGHLGKKLAVRARTISQQKTTLLLVVVVDRLREPLHSLNLNSESDIMDTSDSCQVELLSPSTRRARYGVTRGLGTLHASTPRRVVKVILAMPNDM